MYDSRGTEAHVGVIGGGLAQRGTYLSSVRDSENGADSEGPAVAGGCQIRSGRAHGACMVLKEERSGPALARTRESRAPRPHATSASAAPRSEKMIWPLEGCHLGDSRARNERRHTML